MNRKQRRAAGAPGAKPALGSAGNAAAASTLAQLFGAAVAQHRSGALADAENRYRHILSLFPDHADSLHNLGLVALQGGNATSAVELIGKAITLNERTAEYHFNIALAWRALNRLDGVAAHLERAIALRSDYALAHLNLGNVRREQGRAADAAACYERAIAVDPKSAAAYFNLANVLLEQGRRDAALDRYQQASVLEPNNPEVQGRFGAALMTQGKPREAVTQFERVAALRPNQHAAQEDLAKAYMAAGEHEAATRAAARALDLNETAQGKALFAQCVKFARFTGDDERSRALLLRALSEAWAPPRELTSACINLIRLNGAVSDGVARANSAWPARLPATDLFGASGMAALSGDLLLLRLLEFDPITDIGLERLLTNVRRAMLTAADEALDERLLPLYCGLARQCFINQYVFSTTADEADRAQQLRTSLEQALAAGEPYPALWPIVVSAYFPLHVLPAAASLLDRPWPEPVAALLGQQVKEPAEERQIATTIPALTEIDGGVSLAVREQYEESPYPRWVTAAPSEQAAGHDNRPPNQPFDALIAGCGTGLSTVEFARQPHGARILAIDLSRASLSYAKRMARAFGFTSIEFGQADIMKLASLGRQFDLIDASGVLHHLADPWEGWRVLLSLLRPGGAMQVGLYSEMARQNIVAARALIAERGYQPIPEDIRRCREDIIGSNDPLLKSVTKWDDFFATNECRDLLFHVQEHRITLREIKSFLAANEAQFAGFLLDTRTLQRFATRFPRREDLTDLDCWHLFETEAPDTFANMYQFRVRKVAARPAETAAAPA